MNTFETDAAFVAHTYARFPLEIVGGKGSVLTGSDGKSYIDLGSGIAVNTLGVCDAGWIAAVTDQLHRFGHTSNLYDSAPCADLAAELCARTGMQKVFFSNSGAEANECAIKAARAYGAAKHGEDCYTILTLKNSFHGRTLTTLAATGQDVFHEKFQPLTPGFVSIEPTPEALAAALDTYKVAAVLFEIVRGEGGVLPLEKSFVDALEKEAAAHDFLLMCDEVQCGNGRSGTMSSPRQRDWAAVCRSGQRCSATRLPTSSRRGQTARPSAATRSPRRARSMCSQGLTTTCLQVSDASPNRSGRRSRARPAWRASPGSV